LKLRQEVLFLGLFSNKRFVCLLLGIERLPLTTVARYREAKTSKTLKQGKILPKTGIVILQVKCA
jgi:hypothetical protein